MPVFGDNLMEMMNSGNGNYPMAIEDLSDDEKEDYFIKDTDALIVAGKIVLSSPFRKKIIPPWKSTSTNNNATTCSCTTKSCSPHSHSTSRGSRSTSDPSTAMNPQKETTPLFPVFCRKLRFGTWTSLKPYSPMPYSAEKYSKPPKSPRNSPTKPKNIERAVTQIQSPLFPSTTPTSPSSPRGQSTRQSRYGTFPSRPACTPPRTTRRE